MASLPRLAANAPLAFSVVRSHFQRSRGKGISIVARSLPGPMRARLVSAAQARGRSDVEVMVLAANGSTGEAWKRLDSAITDAARNGEASSLTRLAETAITLHWPVAADRALAALPQGQQPPVTSALLAAEKGRIAEALGLLKGVSGRSASSLRARLVGEAQILQAVGVTTLPKRDDETRDRQSGEFAGEERGDIAGVLHVVSSSLPEQQAGYTIRTHGIVWQQRQTGLEAQVVTRLGFPVDVAKVQARRLVEVDGVPYHRLLPAKALPVPSLARQDIAVQELVSLAKSLGSPLLHAHSKHENGQVALRAAAQLGCPVVYEARGFLEETWRTSGGSADCDFYRWSKLAETEVMKRSDMVVTLADCMRADIIGRGVDESKVVVVPNAVPDAFTEALPDGSEVRERLGIGSEAMVFGTVTTLNAYEGIDTVINAMRTLVNENIYFVVVGDGSARQEWERSASDLRKVIFVGRVPHAHVRDYLGAFDMFVVPRRATPVTQLVPPIKPLEAMAGGVPVLASDLPPLVEIVRPGDLGEVAVADNSLDWAETMRRLSYAREHVEFLGACSREFVKQERTWSSLMPRYSRVYESAGR